jgi:hypothetical protein
MELNRDILQVIFLYLKFDDLFRKVRVCKAWKDIITNKKEYWQYKKHYYNVKLTMAICKYAYTTIGRKVYNDYSFISGGHYQKGDTEKFNDYMNYNGKNGTKFSLCCFGKDESLISGLRLEYFPEQTYEWELDTHEIDELIKPEHFKGTDRFFYLFPKGGIKVAYDTDTLKEMLQSKFLHEHYTFTGKIIYKGNSTEEIIIKWLRESGVIEKVGGYDTHRINIKEMWEIFENENDTNILIKKIIDLSNAVDTKIMRKKKFDKLIKTINKYIVNSVLTIDKIITKSLLCQTAREVLMLLVKFVIVVFIVFILTEDYLVVIGKS